MSLTGFMEERDERRDRAEKMAERDRACREWMNQAAPAEVRLLRFDTWARRELELRLDWTWAGEQKTKRINQCRIEIEGLVCRLWERGWMLDGKRLAAHLQAALEDVSAAQKAGRVKSFWPFFQSVMQRYVGVNAEEIQNEAMSAGAHVAAVFEQLAKKAPTLPELMAQRRAETIREAQTRQRRAEAVKAARDGQLGLF